MLLLRERVPGERHKRMESAHCQQLTMHTMYEMRGSLPTRRDENNTLDRNRLKWNRLARCLQVTGSIEAVLE
jgi:hypothetical protein